MGKTPAQFGAQYAYSYDAVSNWTQQTAKPANTTTAYTANALNQYTQAGTAELKYDKNGNLTQDETFTYAYDWRNLITEVRTTADNAVVAQYRYDALGRRVAKVDGLSGDVTRYVLDGWNVVEERDDSGAVAASYVYDERGLPIAMQRSGKLYFYHYNHLGSIESVTNSDGDVVEQYRYDPFGGMTIADGAGNALPSSQIDNPFFFAGQWRDDETGLYYMRHRYYSASLGRFTSRDPLEYVDGLNAYAYAMSNPVNFSDPLGLSTSAGAFNTGAGNPMAIVANTYDKVVGYIQNGIDARNQQLSRWNELFQKSIAGNISPLERSEFSQINTDLAIESAVGMMGGIKTVGGGVKVATEVLTKLTGEEFVHVAPQRFAKSIAERGVDPSISGGKVYVTKLKYIDGKTAEQLETSLYKKSLQQGKVGYFSNEGIVKIVMPENIQLKYRGMTTRPNGVPQWTYEGPPLKDLLMMGGE